ncbi:HPP family protein [Halobellus captivus]|uniref:HPP family protein n=1 Tax=Halobellus captivus TaxID=2592614 RepID=UPI001EF00254|nr:HPP family protein [Halobellus captivus]
MHHRTEPLFAFLHLSGLVSRKDVGDDVAVGLRAGLLLSIAAAVAWLSGAPAVFPSLGPSAYVLSTARRGPSGRVVVGGHAVGVVAGLVSYIAVSAVVPVPESPLLFDPPWLAISAVLALMLTTIGMRLTNLVHPPACATTLIVSLGLLEPLPAVVVVLPAVASLLVVDRALDGSLRR